MTTGDVIVGSVVSTSIVCTPLPGILKWIVSVPAFVLASVIAWRSDPAPLSAVLVTVYVVAVADAATNDRIRTIRAERTRSAREVVMAFPPFSERPAVPGSTPTGGSLRPHFNTPQGPRMFPMFVRPNAVNPTVQERAAVPQNS